MLLRSHRRGRRAFWARLIETPERILCSGSAAAAFSLRGRLLELAVREQSLIGVRGAARDVEAQCLHIRRGIATAVAEELLTVVLAGLLDGLGTGDDVVDQVQREVIGLLVVTSSRYLSAGAVHRDAAVERDDVGNHLRRNSVIDDGGDRVGMRDGVGVLLEPLGRNEAIPRVG